MELCTEGSLHNILENPENGHGLSEQDFFDVLRDVGKFAASVHFTFYALNRN